jgi:hypothetical protein
MDKLYLLKLMFKWLKTEYSSLSGLVTHSDEHGNKQYLLLYH